jgi:hypothetical protein
LNHKNYDTFTGQKKQIQQKWKQSQILFVTQKLQGGQHLP